jgi:hypothetical protein
MVPFSDEGVSKKMANYYDGQGAGDWIEYADQLSQSDPDGFGLALYQHALESIDQQSFGGRKPWREAR